MSTPTLSFDGTDDYVQTPVAANYGTGDFAVSGWVNLNTVPYSSSRTTIASTYDGSGWILGPAFGEWRFWTTNGNNAVGGSPETDVWQHLCGVRDGSGDLTLYLDGEVLATGTSTSDVTNTADTYIGAEPDQDHVIDGQLDDVRVFNQSVTQSEVRDVMKGQILGTENSIWMMNEGTGTTLTNAAQNNSGTINGATWSTRSGGNTYEWDGVTINDNAQSVDDIAQIVTNVGEGVQIGQPSSHLVGSSEEARYIFGTESSESQLVDESSANNDSVTVDGVGHYGAEEKFYGEYAFSDSGGYVELPTAIQDTTNFVATELWFNLDSTGEQRLINSKDFYTLYYDRSGTDRQINVALNGDNATLGPTLTLDQWIHLNFYWDIGTEVGLSINGSDWFTSATSVSDGGRSNTFQLGANEGGTGDFFDGSMTNVRFVADQKIPIADSLYQTNGALLTGTQP